MSSFTIPDYVELEINTIINTHFSVENMKNFYKYRDFFTLEILKDIHLFNRYKLNSKHLYNFIYIYLKNEFNMSKDIIIEKLREEVELNNSEMELIKKNDWSIKDYIEYKDGDKSENNIKVPLIDEDNKEEVETIGKKVIKSISIIPCDVLTFDKYIFCTNCGLAIYGFREGTIGGALGSMSCSCKQSYKNIDTRNKNYCGLCGKHLNSSYCGYCGSKNY